MTEKIVSTIDAEGYFIGPAIADESPLEPGVFLIPAGAVDIAPPVIPMGKRAKFNGASFVLENIPAPAPEPEPVPPSPEQIAQAVANARQMAHAREADPIFFKWQREEATKEQWLAKVEEIKARYPDGVLPQ